MTSHLVNAGSLALFGFIGLLLGAAQLVSLNENVRLYTGGGSRSAAAAFHVTRLVLAAVAWLAIARFGRAPGLLGAFAGFLVVRPIVTTWLGRRRS
jgi:UPF0716 family protein affecting phage T7 exclusion